MGIKKIMIRVNIKTLIFFSYLFAPAAPCSYSLPVSSAPAVPLVMPLLLAFSLASSGLVPPCCPGSTIFCSLGSLFTAVGSCSFILAGVIGSLSLYDVNGSSFLPASVPGTPSSNCLSCPLTDVFSLLEPVTLSLAPVTLSLASVAFSLALSLAPLVLVRVLCGMLVACVVSVGSLFRRIIYYLIL